jgi:hypothetical protein
MDKSKILETVLLLNIITTIVRKQMQGKLLEHICVFGFASWKLLYIYHEKHFQMTLTVFV